MTLLVLVTAFASLYGNLLGFSRIPFAAARDGAFLPAFARLHPRKDIPHVALLAVGVLSLIASLFTLDQVIAFLTAGIVLIQGDRADRRAWRVLRARAQRARRSACRSIRCPRSSRWRAGCWAFVATGAVAIALGVGWLVCGSDRLSRRRARTSAGGRSLDGCAARATLCRPRRCAARAERMGELERLAHRRRSRLSGLHRRRTAVLSSTARPFFTNASRASVAVDTAGVQAARDQHDRSLRHLELARSPSRRTCSTSRARPIRGAI